MGVASEDSSGVFSFPKNLSVWWSEESEHVLQRIERWAAYARGYNRLRSVRLSPGRMTMQEEPESRWSISQATQRIVVENNSWSPRFRQQAQRRAPNASLPEQTQERSRLRGCCALASLDYKSNGRLDSSCLEAYSLDHSIYFKTIGEIRATSNGNSNRSGSSDGKNGNGNGGQQQQQQQQLDCGDFLASDFDELDDDEELKELDEVDFELGDQLDQLEAACGERLMIHSSQGNCPDEMIQVCRSLISSEDWINNNSLQELQRPSPPPRRFAAAAAQ